MRFVVFLFSVWLALYATLYAIVGTRLARWLGRRPRVGSTQISWTWRAPETAGQLLSAVMALVAFAGAWAVLALVCGPQLIEGAAGEPLVFGSFTGEPNLPTMLFFALGQLASFAMGLLTSLLGNVLHSRLFS